MGKERRPSALKGRVVQRRTWCILRRMSAGRATPPRLRARGGCLGRVRAGRPTVGGLRPRTEQKGRPYSGGQRGERATRPSSGGKRMVCRPAISAGGNGLGRPSGKLRRAWELWPSPRRKGAERRPISQDDGGGLSSLSRAQGPHRHSLGQVEAVLAGVSRGVSHCSCLRRRGGSRRGERGARLAGTYVEEWR